MVAFPLRSLHARQLSESFYHKQLLVVYQNFLFSFLSYLVYLYDTEARGKQANQTIRREIITMNPNDEAKMHFKDLRSGTLTNGIERAAHRALLYSTGLEKDDLKNP